MNPDDGFMSGQWGDADALATPPNPYGAGPYQQMKRGYWNTPWGPTDATPGPPIWRLTWWQNVLMLAMVGLLIALVTANGGMAYGMLQTQPQLEETTAHTAKMGKNMDELKSNAEKFWAERMVQFGATPEAQKAQYNAWVKQTSDIVASVHQVTAVMSEQAQRVVGDFGGIVHAGVGAAIGELVPQENRHQVSEMLIDSAAIVKKFREVADGMSPEDIHRTIKVFTKLAEDVDGFLESFVELRTRRAAAKATNSK